MWVMNIANGSLQTITIWLNWRSEFSLFHKCSHTENMAKACSSNTGTHTHSYFIILEHKALFDEWNIALCALFWQITITFEFHFISFDFVLFCFIFEAVFVSTFQNYFKCLINCSFHSSLFPSQSHSSISNSPSNDDKHMLGIQRRLSLFPYWLLLHTDSFVSPTHAPVNVCASRDF